MLQLRSRAQYGSLALAALLAACSTSDPATLSDAAPALSATRTAMMSAPGTRAAPEEGSAGAGRWAPVNTFSILGFDPETGMVGGAVQSRVFSVGNGVLWAEAEVGVVATQAIVDVGYGPRGLVLLKQGMSPEEIVVKLHEDDPDPDPRRWTKQGRQFAVMDHEGKVAAFTGPAASEWAGHEIGLDCSAQGNILAGPEVVGSMVQAFEEADGHLAERLVRALEAGQEAGGDKRGKQSAALVIVKKGAGPWLNNDVVLRLQVDDHPEPIKELRRLVEKARVYYRWK